MAAGVLHLRSVKRLDYFWVVFAVVLAGGWWLTVFVVDIARLDPDEALSALSEQPFGQPLPPGVTFDSRNLHRGRGAEDVVGYISFADIRKTKEAHGGAVFFAYQIHSSAAQAKSAFNEYWRDFNRSAEIFSLKSVREDHRCAKWGGSKFCQAVIGPVVMEANSHIPWFFEGEGFHLELLMRSAIDHFDGVTAGV
jgi:hypothetical protein